MKFYDGKDKSKIIEKYTSRPINNNKKSDDVLIQEIYLDGHKHSLWEKKSYEEKLDEVLLEQAKKRDEDNFKLVKFEVKKDIILFLLSSPLVIAGMVSNIIALFAIAGLINCYYLFKLYYDNIKLNELKKYRIYISMMDELNKPENANILKSIDLETIYLAPLKINTLDQYSYSDMKVLKKELKRRQAEKIKECYL